MNVTVYQATYETGWRASVKDTSEAAARKRLKQTGRGERFTMKAVNDSAFAVFGNDADDDYTEGE